MRYGWQGQLDVKVLTEKENILSSLNVVISINERNQIYNRSHGL